MKIAVMGAGALGGYFGGRLAAAGHEVSLIARGAHLAAIKANGLRIESPLGDVHLPDIAATDDPATIGPVDVIMFMVKNYDLDRAAQAIAPMIGPETMVITCQNGVSAPDRLGEIIGAVHVVPGVARIPGDISDPGVIRHNAPFDSLTFGESGGGTSDRCTAFRDALQGAGTTPVLHPNIRHDLWLKFIAQSALSSITTAARLNIGPLRDTPATREIILGALAEAEAVGRAEIPDLPKDIGTQAWAFLEGMPPTVHASMLDDLDRGKPLEMDYLGGEVVRLGRAHGIPTPIQSVLTAILEPYSDGRPG